MNGDSMEPVRIVITWDPAVDRLEVESPIIGNKVLMYGILDVARDVVAEVVAKANAPRIAPFSVVPKV